MADKEETEGTEEKAKGGLFENKAIVLGIIVIVQAVLAIGLTQFLIVPKLGVQDAAMDGAEVEDSAPEMPEMGVLVNLEDIVVTLAGNPKKPRYLRININVEVPNALIAEVVSSRLPQLRDMVIMTLSGKTAEEISTPEGKKGLRDEIFRRMDEKMPEGTLMNIYFSDLVVQ
ncbi:MAG: flagellar basal body-associated FliL family protein [bacterium]|nr:flagellar basal body-associated FliL family protein [bacterium]